MAALAMRAIPLACLSVLLGMPSMAAASVNETVWDGCRCTDPNHLVCDDPEQGGNGWCYNTDQRRRRIGWTSVRRRFTYECASECCPTGVTCTSTTTTTTTTMGNETETACDCPDDHPYCASDAWCYDLTHVDLQRRRRMTRRRVSPSCSGTCIPTGTTQSNETGEEEDENVTSTTGGGGCGFLCNMIDNAVNSATGLLSNPQMWTYLMDQVVVAQQGQVGGGGSTACQDNDDIVISVMSGYGIPVTGCSDVAAFCDHASFGQTCRAACPATCGVACGASTTTAPDGNATMATSSAPSGTTASLADVQEDSGGARHSPALAAIVAAAALSIS